MKPWFGVEGQSPGAAQDRVETAGLKQTQPEVSARHLARSRAWPRLLLTSSFGGRLPRSITVDEVVMVLAKRGLVRGAPEYIRCVNGPKFVAAAIRDWCWLSGTGTSSIDPGSP
jgi:hypothetical protein